MTIKAVSLCGVGLVFSTLTTILCVGCFPEIASESDIKVTNLLRRSDMTSWETEQLPITGIEIEVPSDRCAFGDEPGLGAGIGLHTLPPPRGVLDDKKCLLQLQIHRMTVDAFERERATDPTGRKGDANEKFRSWIYRRHDSMSRWDGGQHTTYRYDLACPDGDVVTSVTSVMNVYEHGVSLYAKEDEATVRRMLTSLRCLDRP